MVAFDYSLEQLREIESNQRVYSFDEFYCYSYSKLYLKYMDYLISKNRDINVSKLQKDYDSYRKHLPIYELLSILYNQLLEDLVDTVMDTKISKDPLSLSILIGNILIPYGILCYPDSFHITNSESVFYQGSIDELDYSYNHFLEGAYVFAGYGCCRHLASFVGDFLTKMGILNDKLSSIVFDKENFDISDFLNPVTNHLILGYIWNHQYYLEDIRNQVYNIGLKEQYMDINQKYGLVLNFSDIGLFQDHLYWSPFVSYGELEIEQVEKCEKEIVHCLKNGDMDKFYEFKERNFANMEKIAYLAPIEMERREEKEKIKGR